MPAPRHFTFTDSSSQQLALRWPQPPNNCFGGGRQKLTLPVYSGSADRASPCAGAATTDLLSNVLFRFYINIKIGCCVFAAAFYFNTLRVVDTDMIESRYFYYYEIMLWLLSSGHRVQSFRVIFPYRLAGLDWVTEWVACFSSFRFHS